jgi:Spy/CpxP family protein refolding chaperone
MTRYLILIGAVLAVALSGAAALAHSSPGMMGGANHRGMMGAGMEGCMGMMQSMRGGESHRPNEQWR